MLETATATGSPVAVAVSNPKRIRQHLRTLYFLSIYLCHENQRTDTDRQSGNICILTFYKKGRLLSFRSLPLFVSAEKLFLTATII